MNVVRLNTAHMDNEGALKIIRNVREVSKRIAILIDTKGPEIRTTKASEVISVTYGDKVVVKGDKNGISNKDCLFVNYNKFVEDVTVNSRILIDDGNLELMVLAKEEDKLICEVENEGVIEGRKSVNIPSVNVKLPSQKSRNHSRLSHGRPKPLLLRKYHHFHWHPAKPRRWFDSFYPWSL